MKKDLSAGDKCMIRTSTGKRAMGVIELEGVEHVFVSLLDGFGQVREGEEWIAFSRQEVFPVSH
jgi:hypothetical protein